MSKEAIMKVIETENNARTSRTQASVDARASILAAEAEGKAEISSALEKAEKDVSEMRSRSDAKSIVAAETLANETENKKAAMRIRAEGRLDKAAAIIVERIVNG